MARWNCAETFKFYIKMLICQKNSEYVNLSRPLIRRTIRGKATQQWCLWFVFHKWCKMIRNPFFQYSLFTMPQIFPFSKEIQNMKFNKMNTPFLGTHPTLWIHISCWWVSKKISGVMVLGNDWILNSRQIGRKCLQFFFRKRKLAQSQERKINKHNIIAYFLYGRNL